MTKEAIIEKYRLYFDDMSDLSTSEESDLFDEVYTQVCTERPWEFTKKEYSGTTDGTVYLTLPSDFVFLTADGNYTTNDFEARLPILKVGNSTYKFVSWSDRRQYADHGGYAYIDIPNNRLVFTVAPSSGQAVSYDYHSRPAALANNESPLFPTQFHLIIAFGMVVNANISQMTDKAKSYKSDNQAKYNEYLDRMSYWNSNLMIF